MVTGETDQAVWDRVRLAHSPEVAGSNPTLATKASSGITAGHTSAKQQLASPFRVDEVCSLTDVRPRASRVSRHISGRLRRGETIKPDRDRHGAARWGLPGRIPVGRRRVR